MKQPNGRHARAVFDQLHPRLYLVLGVIALWFAIAVWAFAGDAYADYLLVVVNGFILIAVAIPVILWRTGHRHGRQPDGPVQAPRSFRDWLRGDLSTQQDRTRCSNAAVEVLLPLGAIAVGMTVIGAIFQIVAHAA
jgi:hypothetical protein